MDDIDFTGLYRQLMKTNFLAEERSPISQRSTVASIGALLDKARDLLPHPFQQNYADPLRENLTSVLRRLTDPNGALDTVTAETLAGAVYQHQAGAANRQDLNRFLAVISNMYRSFLDGTKRSRLGVRVTTTLPPMAMFQSDPNNGPFTITNDAVRRLTGGTVGAVSLPYTFAKHPLLYGSLAHETGGHDVIHADPGLLDELGTAARNMFDGVHGRGLGLLWQYWMDEAAADIYGVMNIGPAFGLNLALLLAVFIGQEQKRGSNQPPLLRSDSGPDDRGILDPHPTDILRLSLAQGAVEALANLSRSTRDSYASALQSWPNSSRPTRMRSILPAMCACAAASR